MDTTTHPAGPLPVPPRTPRPPTGDRRAVLAACAGNVVEWYDYAIYSGSATVLAVFFIPVFFVVIRRRFPGKARPQDEEDKHE